MLIATFCILFHVLYYICLALNDVQLLTILVDLIFFFSIFTDDEMLYLSRFFKLFWFWCDIPAAQQSRCLRTLITIKECISSMAGLGFNFISNRGHSHFNSISGKNLGRGLLQIKKNIFLKRLIWKASLKIIWNKYYHYSDYYYYYLNLTPGLQRCVL